MLVLNRRSTEKVLIFDTVTSTLVTEIIILGWGKEQVKLGFEADERYAILRPDMKKKYRSSSIIEEKVDIIYNK